jgi:glycerol-3-phosphate acyltransferase PlsY
MILWFLPLAAFVSGSIPFAVIVGKMWGVDVRTAGSGNPGASNVYRTCGPVPGVLVFVLDAAKGALPVLAARLLPAALETSPDPVFVIWLALVTGMASALGHIFSPFLGFKGGKGVATFLGVFLVIFPEGVLLAIAAAALIILLTRTFSLGSLVGAVILPCAYFLFTEHLWAAENLPILIITVLAAILVVLRHRDNIKRLRSGTEHKVRDV